eukprot:8915093-Prorocentrum_lima.AAC.1
MRAAVVAALPRLPCCPGDPVHHGLGSRFLACATSSSTSCVGTILTILRVPGDPAHREPGSWCGRSVLRAVVPAVVHS